MKIHALIASILCAVFSLTATNTKIIIQVSPPRCLSTAILRMWEARGDFVVMNEPLMGAYVPIHSPCLSSEQPNPLQLYNHLIKQILAIAETQNVFLKEESSVFIDYLMQDTSLLKDPRVHIIVLLRNPHHATISYYNRHKRIIPNFSYFLGFQPCYEIYQLASRLGIHSPLVIVAEDFYTRPEATAQTLCRTLGIPFLPHMLSWNSLGDNFQGGRWFDMKDQPTLYHWHSDAIKSTSFHQPHSYEVDARGLPTFFEITSIEDRYECLNAYYFNKPFYDLLLPFKMPIAG